MSTCFANAYFYSQVRVIEGMVSNHGTLTPEPWNLAPEYVRVLPLQFSVGVEPTERGAQVIAFKCLSTLRRPLALLLHRSQSHLQLSFGTLRRCPFSSLSKWSPHRSRAEAQIALLLALTRTHRQRKCLIDMIVTSFAHSLTQYDN